MNQEEKSLVEALHRGERYACDDLVQQYASMVYNVAMRLTGHPDEAEEVLQETFINACRDIGTFEGRSGLNTWLYRIATNNSLMCLRRRKLPAVSLETMPDETDSNDSSPDQLSDWAWNPETIALNGELRRVIDEGIEGLSESLRSVFVLRDLENLSTAETAEILDISPSSVKVRLHRARFMLREHMAAYFGDAAGKGF